MEASKRPRNNSAAAAASLRVRPPHAHNAAVAPSQACTRSGMASKQDVAPHR